MLSQAISPSIYMVYAESFLEDESPQPASELEETEETTSLPEDTVASENISEKEDKNDSPSVFQSEENSGNSESKSEESAGSTEQTSEANIKDILENESILQSFSAPPSGGPGPNDTVHTGGGVMMAAPGRLRLWDGAGNSPSPSAQAWRSSWTDNSIRLIYLIGEPWDPFMPFGRALSFSGAPAEIVNNRNRHIGYLVGIDKWVLTIGYEWMEHTFPLHYRITEFPDDDIVNTSSGNSRARFTVRITDEVAPHGWIDLYGYVQVQWPSGNNSAIYMGATQGSGGVFLYNPQTQQIEFKRHERNSSTMSSNAGTFYTFSVRRPGTAQTIENINPIFSFTANGADTVDALRTRYNSASKPAFAYGDVVEVFHAQPNRVGTLSSGNVQGLGSVADSRDGNRGYLELTSSGYRQLTFNRATPRQTTISTNTTNAQLDASLANYLDMSRAAGAQIERFIAYPDRSRAGTSTGVIRVRQQLSTGNFVYRDYQVPFNVQDGIQADITHQNLFVGETFDINKSVSNVRYRGTTLNSNQYTLEFQLGTVLDVAGTRNLSVKVTHNASGDSADFSVPITLRWGNTIMFRGINDRAGGALAYVPSERRLGMTRGSYEVLAPTHPNFPDEYFNISLLRNSANHQNLTELPEYYKFSSPGTWTAEQNQQNFGNRTINYGDILKVYHAEAQGRLRIFNNETEGSLSHKDNVAYLELTPTGYRQVLLDRVTPRTGTISRRMTDSQLDQQAATYLNLADASNVKIVGFTRYPDRSRLGQTTGTIQVQEKLSNGNYVQMSYDVPFTVHQGLEAAPVAQTLILGESLDLEKAVGEVKYNNAVLARDAYELEYDPGLDLDVAGSRNTTVTVIHKATGERIQVNVPVTIRWGNTIMFRGIGDRSGGALAYVPSERRLRMTRGSYEGLASTHPNFPNEYFNISLLRNSANHQNLTELSEYYKFSSPGTWTAEQNRQGFGNRTIIYGDILKVYHAEARNRLRIFNNETEGALSHSNNIAYLELTPTGYRQVLIDRVTSRAGTISRNMTDAQLDQQAASYLNLSNAPNVEVVGFTRYPDRSTVGQTTGTIQVQEKLSNGNYVQMTYDVPFTVTAGLEASAVAQTLNLGQILESSQVVKDVKYNGQALSNNDFEVKISENGNMNLVGSRTLNASITHKATTETIEVEIPVTIQWGNTLLLKGTGRHESLGISLVRTGNQLQLVGTKGSEDRNLQLHTGSYLDTAYLKIGLISGQQNIELNLPNYQRNFTYYGRDYKFDIIDDFGVNAVQVGDVVEVYHQESLSAGRMISLYTDGVEEDIHSGNRLVNQTTYYETTNDGLRLLFINQLTPKNTTISQTMRDQQLDAAAETYLEFGNAKNVEVVGFTRYPDRSTVGQTTGTIQVQEKLSNGNYVQMTYDVPFTVTAGLEASAVAQTLNLGETLDPIQVVKDVKYNGQTLSNNDFEVKISENGIMNLVGSRTLNASITHKATTETIEVEIPVTIQWGNTLLLKGTSRHESLGLSLIRAGNQLQLVGTKGSEDRNLQLHTGLFLDAAYLKIGLISGQQNIALNLPNYQRNFTYYGRDYKFDIVNDFGVNMVQVGDVVEVYHQESISAGRMISLYTNSVEADIHPANQLINPTTYYETTNDGLRLLFINQLSSKNTTISQTMSDQQLDAAAETYLEFGNAQNVEVVGFTRYPDRSRQWQSLGTIQVQEKLSNGNYIQMTYDVLFTVHQGLEAAPVAQSLTLGESLDLEKAVGEVKYNNTVLARDAYELEYSPGQDLDVPGSRNTTVTVVHKASGERIQVQVPVTITWGETLLFRGHADRSAGALAYLPGENKLVARRGDYTAVAPIHPSFPNLYYSLAVLRNTESKQALNELNTVTSYEAAGNRNVNDHVRDIGTISITHGDILKVYHEEPNYRLRIFNNEVEGALSHRNNIAYLELTPTGYRQVLLDRVTPRTGTISRNMTDKQLDQQAATYLNLTGAPNVEVVGFTSYPDRSKLGQTTGTIQVQEKLSNGNYVQMSYDVSFTVEGTREITNVSNFEFGTIRKSNRRQVVTALNEKETPLGLQLSDYIGTSNWSLQAYQSSPFQNANGNELRGAEISLKNIVSQSDQAANLHTQTEVNLNTQPIEIANYIVNNSAGNHPVGNTTILFGTENTSGVELQVPNSLEASEDTYRTTINWELVADPSQGVN